MTAPSSRVNSWMRGARRFWRPPSEEGALPITAEPHLSVADPLPPDVATETRLLAVSVDDLDRGAEILKQFSTRRDSPWDEFRDRYLELPSWFDKTLDPFSTEYARQQDLIWQWVAGRSAYVAADQEQTPEAEKQEHIYRPAFYVLRAAGMMVQAGDHIIAIGHFLKRSGIVANDRVLEYGAGYGQTALAFARMGAIVDTVDINPFFCRAITAQAEFFKVPLTAFPGEFGDNPRPGEKYRLIFFYEAFHHCRDFMTVIGKLREHLTPDGKIMMAGEPITTDANSPSIPYPWGLRLDAENAAVVRWRGWYELGFHEDFLVQCFIRNGFSYRKYPCDVSDFAVIYEFKPRAEIIEMATEQLAPADAATWYEMESNGRWTRAHSTLTLDTRAKPRLKVTAINFHPQPVQVRFTLGGTARECSFEPHKRLDVVLEAEAGHQLEISCTPISPTAYGSPDQRQLGIFVQSVTYA